MLDLKAFELAPLEAKKRLDLTRPERRIRRLEISLNDREFAQISRRAAETGHRLGAWARHVLTTQRQPRSMSVPPELLAAFQRLGSIAIDLRGAAANLNQLTHHLNREDKLGRFDKTELVHIVQVNDLAQQVEVLRAEVGLIRRLLNPVE